MKLFSYSLIEGFFQVLFCSADFTNLFTFRRSLIYWPEKGGLKLDISQAQMPMVQKSIYFPQPYLSTISGAQYMLVPASVLLSSSSLISLANPKSVSLTQPSSKIKTFSGFRSRYMMFFLCNCSIPKIRQANINRTAFSPAALKSSTLFEPQQMREYVSPPCAHSITKQRNFSSRKAQQSEVMKLDLDYCRILFSSCRLEVSFFFMISDFSTRLIAYFSIMPLSLFYLSSARNTSPKPPPPILQLIQKFYHFIDFLSTGGGQQFWISTTTSSYFLSFFRRSLLFERQLSRLSLMGRCY